jgi:hypothetical protein
MFLLAFEADSRRIGICDLAKNQNSGACAEVEN